MITLFMIACILMNIRAKKLSVKCIEAGIGIRVALISDLHFDTVLIKPSLIVNEICARSPDVIAITGDLCSDLKYFERVTSFIDLLAYKAACPVFITLGNHDCRIFESGKCTKEKYISVLESISPNVRVLENERVVYKDVLIGGLGDLRSNDDDYVGCAVKWNEEAEENGYKYILLTHNPDIVIDMPDLSALTLILAGHTHGGQVRVPFNIEFRLLKKDILPKKNIFYGMHEYGGNRLYITSGIGCSAMPIRFGSRAEAVIFE